MNKVILEYYITGERMNQILRSIADAIRYNNPEAVDQEVQRLYDDMCDAKECDPDPDAIVWD